MSDDSTPNGGSCKRSVDFPRLRQVSYSHVARLVPEKLPGGRREGREWVALNPTRDDRNLGSFRINLDTGQWCDHADPGAYGADIFGLWALLDGVSQVEAAIVVAALMGVSPYKEEPKAVAAKGAGLTLEAYAVAKGFDAGELRKLGLETIDHKGRKALLIPYKKRDGSLLRCRIRIALGKPENGAPRMFWDKNTAAGTCLYGLDQLPKPGCPVFLVEGESDCHALWAQGWDAVGVPGASNFNPRRDDEELEGFDVIVLLEADGGGAALLKELKKSRHSSSIRAVTFKDFVGVEGVKDPSDLRLKAPGEFDGAMRRIIEQAEPLEALLQRAPLGEEAAVTSGPTDMAAEIRKLARMGEAAFAAGRSEHAERLKLTRGDLDKLVKAERRKLKAETTRADASDEDGERKRTQADVLVDLAKSAAIIFKSPDDTAYAKITVGDHREVWAIRSRGFKLWLTHTYYTLTGKAPNSDAINQAQSTFEAIAAMEGEVEPVCVRRGASEDQHYIDLCDETWRAIEIDATGWRIVDNPPINFTRYRGMLPLSEPERGGSIDELRPLLNVASDGDFKLIVGWLLAAMRAKGPYPVLAAIGEPGTAKSSTARLLRALVDPHVADIRAVPTEARDLYIAANNSGSLVYDNISSIPTWLSDALCIVATGGAYAKRGNYTDTDETFIKINRPVAFTAVGAVIARADLTDRAIVVVLAPIKEKGPKGRKAESWFAEKLAAATPRIIGALLDGLVHGIAALPYTTVPGLPRMADFALWTRACEGMYWTPGDIQEAFETNMRDAIDAALEGDFVAIALKAWLAASGLKEWKGRSELLHAALVPFAPEGAFRERGWPKNGKALSDHLMLIAPSLRKTGINVDRGRNNVERWLSVEKTGE